VDFLPIVGLYSLPTLRPDWRLCMELLRGGATVEGKLAVALINLWALQRRTQYQIQRSWITIYVFLIFKSNDQLLGRKTPGIKRVLGISIASQRIDSSKSPRQDLESASQYCLEVPSFFPSVAENQIRRDYAAVPNACAVKRRRGRYGIMKRESEPARSLAVPSCMPKIKSKGTAVRFAGKDDMSIVAQRYY
jgi:hypothetical protein